MSKIHRMAERMKRINSLHVDDFKKMTTSKARHLRHRDKQSYRYLLKRENQA